MNLKQMIKKMKKNILLKDYISLIKNLKKKTKEKLIKRDLKQIKKEYIELLKKKYGEIKLARHLKH